jgi:ssDNA-binding replication factor A large subunit
MFRMPIEDIIQKITTATPELSVEDINTKIDAKVAQLSGLISREGAAHIIANEQHVTLFETVEGAMQIKDIVSGMKNVETTGKVQRRFDVREFQTASGAGKEV